jgi:hypothetical protein
MLRRFVCAAFCAFIATAAGCGGTVKQDAGEPAEQLRKGSADRCKAACVTLVACGIGAESCSCSCAPCPAGSASCACPCDCGSEKTTPASCEASCGKAVKELLEETPACDGAMLTLLDCVASATCKPHETPCETESRAMKACAAENRGSSSPPPAGSPDTEPGDPGSPGPAGTVACHITGATSPTSNRDGSRPPPGTVVCEGSWDDCSDGRSYGLECSATSGPDLACTCIVNGERRTTFQTIDCVPPADELNAQCGWSLQ